MSFRRLGKQFFMIKIIQRKLIQSMTDHHELHHGQLPLLETIISQPDCTQQELAQILHITPASVAQSAAKLQKAGLIEKRVDPDNKRCNRICATETGVHVAEHYRRSFDEMNRLTFSGLTQEEQAQLSQLLDKILSNFGKDFCQGPLPMHFNEEDPHR